MGKNIKNVETESKFGTGRKFKTKVKSVSLPENLIGGLQILADKYEGGNFSKIVEVLCSSDLEVRGAAVEWEEVNGNGE